MSKLSNFLSQVIHNFTRGWKRDMWDDSVFKHWYQFVQKSQWWDHETLRAYQNQKLRELVWHAYNNVPYYRRVFNEKKIKPDDIQVAEDLSKLPLLTKQIVRDNFQELVAQNIAQDKVVESHTSGTTGAPLTFLLDPDSYARENAFVARAWSFGGYTPGDPIVVLRSYVPKEGQKVYYHEQGSNYLYLSAYHLSNETMRQYFEMIQSFGARVLRGYASSIYIFALFLQEHNFKLDKITSIVTSSETLLPHYRATIEKVFGLKVLDWYGSNERVVTCQQCPVNHGYHLNVDYGVLEVVDEQNQDQVIDQGNGFVVGTSLHNYAMPLIRYLTDDYIEIQDNPPKCACGRGLPLTVKNIQGRADEILTFPDRSLPPINFYTLFHEIPNIKQFQMIQQDRDLLRVRLVVSDAFSDENKQDVIVGLKERVGENVEIKLDFVDEITRDSTTGKIKCIINKTLLSDQ